MSFSSSNVIVYVIQNIKVKKLDRFELTILTTIFLACLKAVLKKFDPCVMGGMWISNEKTCKKYALLSSYF